MLGIDRDVDAIMLCLSATSHVHLTCQHENCTITVFFSTRYSVFDESMIEPRNWNTRLCSLSDRVPGGYLFSEVATLRHDPVVESL